MPVPTTGGAASQVFSTTAGISGTTDDALFQDERWTPGGSYTYEVAVANGTYQVDLLLAEIYSGIFGPGQRVFDMSLEGQALAALQNIDVYAQVGANAAYTISQQVTVNDGSLSIEVGPGSSSPGNVQNAKTQRLRGLQHGGADVADIVNRDGQRQPERGQQRQHGLHLHGDPQRQHGGASSASYAVTGSGANPATAADFTGGVLPDGHGELRRRRDQQDDHVNVAGDTAVESTEGFTVTLSNPSAGTAIGTATATGTILNDDAAPGRRCRSPRPTPARARVTAADSLHLHGDAHRQHDGGLDRGLCRGGQWQQPGNGGRLRRRRPAHGNGELRRRRDQQDDRGERRGGHSGGAERRLHRDAVQPERRHRPRHGQRHRHDPQRRRLRSGHRCRSPRPTPA